MEKKRKTIIFTITGVLAIVIICIAGYYIWQNQSISREGTKYSQEYLSKYVINCNDAVYVSGENVTLFGGNITPMKSLIQVKSVDAYATASDEPITEKERRELIDWKGRITVVNGKFREYNFNSKKWGDWEDSPIKVDLLLGSSLYRANGKWQQESMANLGTDLQRGIYKSIGVAPKPIACSDIPK